MSASANSLAGRSAVSRRFSIAWRIWSLKSNAVGRSFIAWLGRLTPAWKTNSRGRARSPSCSARRWPNARRWRVCSSWVVMAIPLNTGWKCRCVRHSRHQYMVVPTKFSARSSARAWDYEAHLGAHGAGRQAHPDHSLNILANHGALIERAAAVGSIDHAMILGNSLRAVRRSKLPQHVLDVCFDSPLGHKQADGDLRVGLSGRQAMQHIPLAAGQRLRDATVVVPYAGRRLRAARRRGHGRLQTLAEGGALHHPDRDVVG